MVPSNLRFHGKSTRPRLLDFGLIPETAGDSYFTTSPEFSTAPGMNASSSIGRLVTIVVTGPRTLEFYEQFSNHRATLIRADGKDILSVKMHLNSETQAERDVETITQAKEWEDLSP